ncbi:MAG: tRNA-dihydrouridine synthase [Deltaproteobacteria bacterium]|nr:tRNA-dihydrouridine synthase [Deltaproteobacteria bacterium]
MLPAVETFRERFGPIRYFLAPMAGITDMAFRILMRELGAQVVVSELLSAEGLIRQGKRTLQMMAFSEAERPVGIQLFGAQRASMVTAAKMVEQAGADFVDLNFGCPVKKVVSDGGGAAWLKDIVGLGQMLKEVKKALSIPLSIKIRTGWDAQSLNALQVVQMAGREGASWVAIHGRTRAQGYCGQADWDLIKRTTEASSLPIVGNGDLVSAQEVQKKLEGNYCHAVMIGRGALKNPWIFRECLGHPVSNKNIIHLILRHFELATSIDGRRALMALKKFMGWYAVGLPNASGFRARIFQTSDTDTLKSIAVEYFDSADFRDRLESPFLMGGQG